MYVKDFIAPLSAAVLVALPLGQSARANLLLKVDKSTQRMAVIVDGRPLYDWPVSTGGAGYNTPSGTFRPFRKDIDHHSKEYDNAPMPYSVFFTRTGDAVHGTYEQRYLGQPVSHGCVRLSVKHAATLWRLVQREKMANTTVVIGGTIQDFVPQTVARARSFPIGPDAPRYEPDGPRYQAPPPTYQQGDDQQRADEQPKLPFPFSLFQQ